MELLKDLGTRLINGKWVRFGIFWCVGCKSEVEKRFCNGIKTKSCGKNECNFTIEKKQKISINTKGKNNPMYGKYQSQETRNKISIVNTGKFSGENNPMYGKKHSEETRQRIKENHIGMLGKKQTEKTKQKQSESKQGINNPMYGKSGVLSPVWNNGSSFEPYAPEFNKELKQQILERDNNTCQYPGCMEIHDRLHVHHIDYNKKNNNPENLITLGVSCHMKTNKKNKRPFWTEFYQNIMINRIVECLL